MEALKARRFYSTYDNNLLLSFRIDGKEMGSVVTGGNRNVEIRTDDGNGEPFVLTELLRNGYVISSWTTGKSAQTIDFPLFCTDREYYYVRVKQADGDEAISSPIWISGGETDIFPAVAGSLTPDPGSLVHHFDFSEDYDGWTGDFADYPVIDSEFYGLEFGRAALPEPLDTGKYALMITGNNHSDDLFMFIKRKITGLQPNKTYRLQIDIGFASEAPTNAIGIGGAPAESVFLKAGATLAEPRKVAKDGFYEINIDKSNQAVPGADMDTIGHIGVSDTTSQFTLISRTNAGHPFTISTDDSGSVWVCIGTDSGFEGTTTLYYNTIDLKFDNITGSGDPSKPEGISVYPNPAREMLFVNAGDRQIEEIGLFSLSGRLAATARHTSRLSLEGLEAGVYWVRVRLADQSVAVEKVVVR